MSIRFYIQTTLMVMEFVVVNTCFWKTDFEKVHIEVLSPRSFEVTASAGTSSLKRGRMHTGNTPQIGGGSVEARMVAIGC